jgi:hypothetical protein
VIRAHHDSLAWQEAIQLVKATYTLTQTFDVKAPLDRVFRLIAGLITSNEAVNKP